MADVDKLESSILKKEEAETDELIKNAAKEIEAAEAAEEAKKEEDKLAVDKKTALGGPQTAGIDTDSLLRIGGAIGGEGREGMNLDKKRNDLLGKLVKTMQKDELGLSQGETMI
jgi:hypothetical protein